MLYSTRPAGGRAPPKYRISFLHSQGLLEVPFLEGTETAQWKSRLFFFRIAMFMDVNFA